MYSLARIILVESLAEQKKIITGEIEAGTRNYIKIEKAYAVYKSCLQAADTLCDLQCKEK